MPAKPQAVFARHLSALPPLRLQMNALVRKLGDQRGLQREEKIATRCLKYLEGLESLTQKLQQGQTVEWPEGHWRSVGTPEELLEEPKPPPKPLSKIPSLPSIPTTTSDATSIEIPYLGIKPKSANPARR